MRILILTMSLFVSGCGIIGSGAGDLTDLGRDLILFTLIGQSVDGANCWDTNENGMCDDSEDLNGDDGCSPIDCQGMPGPPGLDGIDGSDGADGMDGVDGVDGIHGLAGPKGSPGVPGSDGADGADGQDGEPGPPGPPGEGGIIIVCHQGNELVVAQPAVQAHLDHGDTLGPCKSDDK